MSLDMWETYDVLIAYTFYMYFNNLNKKKVFFICLKDTYHIYIFFNSIKKEKKEEGVFQLTSIPVIRVRRPIL
jgi:hypothetical protein